MAIYRYTNFAEGRLVLDLPEDGVLATIGVTESQTFPTPLGVGEAFRITVFDGQQAPEIMEVVGNDGDGELFVNRGKEGTVPKRWPSGTLIRLCPTAEQFEKLIQDAATVPVYSSDVTFDSGTDLYTITVPSIYFGNVDGRVVTFKVPAGGTNEGACSARLSDGTSFTTARPIKSGTSDPQPGELVEGTNVTLIYDSGTFTWQYSTQPVFKQDGAGSVSRPISAKAKDFVTAEDYGSVGDGHVDDLQAIKAALAAKGHVTLTKPVYYISGVLEIKSGQAVYGNKGTIITGVQDYTPNAGVAPTYGGHDLIKFSGGQGLLRDVILAGGSNAIRFIGELGPNVGNQVENVDVWDCVNGVFLDGGLALDWVCQFNSISDVTIYRPQNAGVLSTVTGAGNAPTANRFTNVKVDHRGTAPTGASKCGFDFQAGRRGNSLIGCGASLHPSALAGVRLASAAFDTEIIDFTVDANTSDGVRIEGSSTGTVVVNLEYTGSGKALNDVGGSRNYLAFNAGDDVIWAPQGYVRSLKADMLKQGFINDAGGGSAIAPNVSFAFHLIDASAGDTTVLLPKAEDSTGLWFHFKKVDSSGNSITFQEDDGPGPDGALYTISKQWSVLEVYCDGTRWLVFGKDEGTTSTRLLNVPGTVVADTLQTGYYIDASAGNITLQLPSPLPSMANKRLFIKRLDGTAANTVTVNALSGTGPDARVWTFDNAYDFLDVICDGVRWLILGTNIQPKRYRGISVAGTTNITALQDSYLVDATLGNILVQLPAASPTLEGREVTIKRTDAGNNSVTIQPAVDGVTWTLTRQYDFMIFRVIGSQWTALTNNRANRLRSANYGISGTLIPTLKEDVCLVSAAGGPVTFQLPTVTADMEGIELFIKKIEASGNAVTVTALTGTGPDGATYALNAVNKGVRVGVCLGAWRVLGSYL